MSGTKTDNVIDSAEKRIIYICQSTGCNSSRAEEIKDEFRSLIKEHNLNIEVKPTGCMGFCQQGPLLFVQPDNVLYVHLKPGGDAKNIVQQHLINGNTRCLIIVDQG